MCGMGNNPFKRLKRYLAGGGRDAVISCDAILVEVVVDQGALVHPPAIGDPLAPVTRIAYLCTRAHTHTVSGYE